MQRAEAPAQRRAAWLVFAWLLLSYAFFFQGGGHNPNSRLDLTRAVALHHTIAIDAFRENTGDWAFARGHYYANKAPGLSLAAVPAFAAARALAAAAGLDAAWTLRVAAWAANVCVNALPTAGFGVLAFACAGWLGIASLRRRAALAVAFGLGTPLFAYATAFYAHAPAGAAAFAAFAALWRARARLPARTAHLLAGAGGGAGGAAVLLEMSTAVLLAATAAAALADARGRRLLPAFIAGGLPFAVALGVYDTLAWGSPFATHVAHANPAAEVRVDGALFGAPDPTALAALLLSPSRGLFCWSPMLVLVFAGFGPLWRRDRFAACVCAAAPLALWLLIGSFHAWRGGWAAGPRYLIPAVPFLFPAFALGAQRLVRLAAVLAALAIAIQTATTAVAVEIPPGIEQPLIGFVLPMLFAGQVSANAQELDAFWYPRAEAYALDAPPSAASFNLGEALASGGAWSLLPLLLAWGALGLALWRLPAGAAPPAPAGGRAAGADADPRSASNGAA